MFVALLTTLLFSLSAVSGRRLAEYLPGTQANFARLVVAALMLGSWAHVFGYGVGGPAFWIFFLSGCVGFGIGDLALFQAYPRIGTRRSMVLVQCLAAPFAALTEWAWLGNAPTIQQAFCGGAILAGVGIALMPARRDAQPTHGLAAGTLFGLLAALCQAWGAVLSRKGYAVSESVGFAITGAEGGINAAYQRLLGGLLVCVMFLMYHRAVQVPATQTARGSNWPHAWPWIVANGLLGPALGVTCYQWALSVEKTSIVLPIVATTPLMVMPFTRVFEKEPITLRALGGGALAVLGVIGLTLAR